MNNKINCIRLDEPVDDAREIVDDVADELLTNEVGVERHGPVELLVDGHDQVGEPAEEVALVVLAGGEGVSHFDELAFGERRGHHAQVRVAEVEEELVGLFALGRQADRVNELAADEVGVKRGRLLVGCRPELTRPLDRPLAARRRVMIGEGDRLG